MKKVLSILLITTILLLTTACGNKEKEYHFKDDSTNSEYYLLVNSKSKDVIIKTILPCNEENCTTTSTSRSIEVPNTQFTKLEKILTLIEPDDTSKNTYLKSSLIGALNNIAFGDRVLFSKKKDENLYTSRYASSDLDNDESVTYLEFGTHTLDSILSSLEKE